MDTGIFETPAEPRTIGTGSFSRLENFEKCPQRAFKAYVEKRKEPATLDRTAANRGEQLHARAEAYVKGTSSDATGLDKVKEALDQYRDAYANGMAVVEQEWAFDPEWQTTGWFDANCWLRVKCDVVLNPGALTCEVVDWKSGKKFGNEVKHLSQGQLYALAAFMRFPDTESVVVSFRYLDHNVAPLTRTYVRNDVPRLLGTWDRRLREMTSATSFKAKPNKINCRYCPWSDNNGGDGSCQWRVPA